MGYYINPPDMTKEQFLKKHGKLLTQVEIKDFDFSSDSLPVCLVDNGAFTAAGIGYDAHEVQAFLHPDHRPKTWYAVSRENLKPYYKRA